MKENTIIDLPKQATIACQSALETLLREGARQMLQKAIENEVAEYLARHGERDADGHRLVVRNGRLPEREIMTPLGATQIHQPRIHDRRDGRKFSSEILPPYMRRTPSLDALIPALYLRGISTGDFGEALSAILGPNAAGLSPTNVVRLKEGWQGDFQQWEKRDLSQKHYVYWWADGIYFNVRLSDDRPCVLVIMGALVAYEQFLKDYGVKYPKACECLQKDKDVLFTFYDFPAKHSAPFTTRFPGIVLRLSLKTCSPQ